MRSCAAARERVVYISLLRFLPRCMITPWLDAQHLDVTVLCKCSSSRKVHRLRWATFTRSVRPTALLVRIESLAGPTVDLVIIDAAGFSKLNLPSLRLSPPRMLEPCRLRAISFFRQTDFSSSVSLQPETSTTKRSIDRWILLAHRWQEFPRSHDKVTWLNSRKQLAHFIQNCLEQCLRRSGHRSVHDRKCELSVRHEDGKHLITMTLPWRLNRRELSAQVAATSTDGLW